MSDDNEGYGVEFEFDTEQTSIILGKVRALDGVSRIDRMTHHWPAYAHLAAAMFNKAANGEKIAEEIRAIPGVKWASSPHLIA